MINCPFGRYTQRSIHMNDDEIKIVQLCISALLLLVNKSETTEAFRQQQENVVKELLLLAAPLPALSEPDGTQENGKIGETAISFTEKEILKMPKQFRKLFRQPKGDHIRLREKAQIHIKYSGNTPPDDTHKDTTAPDGNDPDRGFLILSKQFQIIRKVCHGWRGIKANHNTGYFPFTIELYV